MKTQEILDAFVRQWHGLNDSCQHGNISIQTMHTRFVALTAQTIEQLCLNIIELETEVRTTKVIPSPLDKIDYKPAAKMIADEIDRKLENEVNKELAIESTVDKLIRESMVKK